MTITETDINKRMIQRGGRTVKVLKIHTNRRDCVECRGSKSRTNFWFPDGRFYADKESLMDIVGYDDRNEQATAESIAKRLK